MLAAIALLVSALHGEEMAQVTPGPAFDEPVLADLFSQLHAPVGPSATVEPPAPAVPAAVEQETSAAAQAALPLPNLGCPDVIIEVFGPAAPAACAVSLCESGWNPNATGSQGEMGWFQIHPLYHSDATYDPRGNTLAAYRISAGGTNWSQWTCRPW